MLRLAVLLCTLVPFGGALFFGGGGGCGCAPPPPPPPCLPSLPQPCIQPIQIPSFCPPPLPRISLPCPPPPCGCGCGRKKRSTPVVSRHHEEANAALCSNPQIRRIILNNITEDPVSSKASIHSELKAKLHGNYVVFCAPGAFSYTADTHNFCSEGTSQIMCHVFEA